MKKIYLTFFFFSFYLFSGAQADLFQELKKIIKETHPEMNLEDKLIAYNVWSIDNAESREANKAFEKAYTVYEKAKLKGGSKGIVVVSVNKDNLSSEAMIISSRDGIAKVITVKLSEVDRIAAHNNGVFDAQGQEVYKDLSSQTVFSSIHKLITR